MRRCLNGVKHRTRSHCPPTRTRHRTLVNDAHCLGGPERSSASLRLPRRSPRRPPTCHNGRDSTRAIRADQKSETRFWLSTIPKARFTAQSKCNAVRSGASLRLPRHSPRRPPTAGARPWPRRPPRGSPACPRPPGVRRGACSSLHPTIDDSTREQITW